MFSCVVTVFNGLIFIYLMSRTVEVKLVVNGQTKFTLCGNKKSDTSLLNDVSVNCIIQEITETQV